MLKDQKDHAVAFLLPIPDSVSQSGDGSFAGLWRNRQADGRQCAGRSLPVAARRQGSPCEDQIIGEARLGAGALSQRSVVAHQEQLAARDDAAQEPSSSRATQIADTDTERRNPHAQRAGEMADHPLQRQRGEPAVVVKHRAAAKDQPVALPQQARHAPDEADEPGMPGSRLIVEDRVNAGGNDVLSKVRQVRAMIAQQKPRSGQDHTQLFDRDRQQEIVAEIAAAVIAGQQYAGAVPVLRHQARLRSRRAYTPRVAAINASKP